MKSKMIKPGYIAIIVISVMLIALLPYSIIFSSGFSKSNLDWANFGDYLSGISSIINVGVFITISFIFKNYDYTNQEYSFKRIQQKEIVCRFASTYEELVTELYSIKISLSLVDFQSKEKNNAIRDALRALVITCRKANTYVNVYIPQNQEMVDKFKDLVDVFLNERLYGLIDLLASEDSDDKKILKDILPESSVSIEDLIGALSELVKSFMIGE